MSLEDIVKGNFRYKDKKNGDRKELYECIDSLIEAAFHTEDMYHKTSKEYMPKFEKNVVEKEYNALKENIVKGGMDLFVWQDEDDINTYVLLRITSEPQKVFFLSFSY